ncbi:cd951dff-517d-478b-ae87-8ca064a3e44f [Thermothielavioides terrestris]|uniref:glutathione transferase n=2 Tax=Thermothielavioides terrestris TaxID=2587410 RepID=G2RAS1_THETT|nr:uncharacterized protein THITE_2120469 [Thermothielavioides terrestris NRRL 8126]AEO69752.1 hypothetical protein THITE_2120469 [Thermothielavioides terrestris NRRL 8126]SPQ26295.1 cd951dff-517d-478b-ae87-8ca064a3e44f [Thermothielavioides terrestris]
MASTQAPAPAATQPQVTLYWLNHSRAQRIVWLLEELGVPYNIQTYQRNQDQLAPPELEKIHPLGKSPVLGISLPDPADPAKQKQLVLAESGFIVQYLCEHFAQHKTLLPKRYRDCQEGQLGGETDEWMRYQYFLHYAEGSLMTNIVVAIVLDVLRSPRIPFFIRPITGSVVSKLFSIFIGPQIAKHLAFLESQLETSPSGGSYLCGPHLTAADILLSFPLLQARERADELRAGEGQAKLAEKYPKLWEYLRRLEQEPGYKRAEAKIEELQKTK